MAETVSDFLVSRLPPGASPHLRLPRRRHQRHHRALSAAPPTGCSSSRSATRRWPRSWRARTPSSPARSASAWPPRAPARSTCSTASTTRSSITSRSSPSSASRRATALGGDYQQEVDLLSLFKDVAHEYVQMATTPAQIRHLVDRAMRIALAERTVTCIIIPNDVQELDAVETPPREHGTVHSGVGFSHAARRSAGRGPRSARTCSTPASGWRCWSAPGALQRDRRGARGGRPARRRRRQGAARQGGAARRPAVRHRLDRPARHQAELGPDEELRHAADGGLELPVRGVPARRRARRAACRSTSTDGC